MNLSPSGSAGSKSAILLTALCLAVAVSACAGPKRAKKQPPASVGASGPPPHVTSCRDYADQLAGRQLQRDFDAISGNFRGGDSRLYQDFARLDAEKYSRQLYESCLSKQRAKQAENQGRQPAPR